MTEIQIVTVVGAGTMGHGIAQACAMAGIATRLVDVDEDRLERAHGAIRDSLVRFVRSGRMTAAASTEALERVEGRVDLATAAADADVVIEAVPEDFALKQELFARLVTVTRPGTVLATNTSQFSVTAIAAGTDRPEDVIATHFFNPPVLMRLVEIARGLRTSDRTLDTTLSLVRRLGKEAAVCRRDAPGFITSRALAALRLECIRIYEEGIASIEDIDRAMRLGLNHPMGPFELNDYNGLDVGLAVAESLRAAYGERFTPPQSLVSRVRAGMLGRKTGQGWYDHRSGPPRPTES